jgi:glycerol-3-phosphate acyltransferase PlsY
MLYPVNIIVGLTFSYVLGAVPTAYIFGRTLKGIDIREHGSGNVGATNTFRVLGTWPGIVVLILDILKGVAALTVVPYVTGVYSIVGLIAFGLTAVAGHNWTIFLNFKGGKGIAASLGVLIGLAIQVSPIRPVLWITILVWLLSFLVFGFVSLSSILAAIALPVLMLATQQVPELIILGFIICLFVVFRHKSNIQRLREGKESRVKIPFHKK